MIHADRSGSKDNSRYGRLWPWPSSTSLSLFRSLTRSLTHFQFFSFRSDFAPCISTLTVSGCFGPRNRAGPGRQTQFARPLLRERINWAAVDERNALHRGGDLARSPSCPIGRLISGRARVWWLVGGEFVKQCALISARLYIYIYIHKFLIFSKEASSDEIESRFEFERALGTIVSNEDRDSYPLLQIESTRT